MGMRTEGEGEMDGNVRGKQKRRLEGKSGANGNIGSKSLERT